MLRNLAQATSRSSAPIVATVSTRTNLFQSARAVGRIAAERLVAKTQRSHSFASSAANVPPSSQCAWAVGLIAAALLVMGPLRNFAPSATSVSASRPSSQIAKVAGHPIAPILRATMTKSIGSAPSVASVGTTGSYRCAGLVGPIVTILRATVIMAGSFAPSAVNAGSEPQVSMRNLRTIKISIV